MQVWRDAGRVVGFGGLIIFGQTLNEEIFPMKKKSWSSDFISYWEIGSFYKHFLVILNF